MGSNFLDSFHLCHVAWSSPKLSRCRRRYVYALKLLCPDPLLLPGGVRGSGWTGASSLDRFIKPQNIRVHLQNAAA